MRASINLRNRNVEDEYGDFELDSAPPSLSPPKTRARTALQRTASPITVVAVTPAVTEKRGRGRGDQKAQQRNNNTIYPLKHNIEQRTIEISII